MNRKHSRHLISLVSSTLLLAPALSHALDFTVRPRLNAGVTYYEFEQEAGFRIVPNGDPATRFDIFGPVGGRSLSDVLPILGAGATVFWDRFFVDAYAQRAYDGNDESSQDQFPPLAIDRDDADFDREEYSLSAGYAVTGNFAVFAGYRVSNTDFDIATQRTIIGATPPDDIVIFADSTLEYEQDGFFIGGNYSWPVKNLGALAVNLGVAFIDGEVKEDSSGKITGDTVGLTVGVSWTGPLPVENLTYTVGVDGYRYNFEADQNEGLDFSETVFRGTAGVSYAFDTL